MPVSDQKISEKFLLEELALQNEKAFQRIYETYKVPVFVYCRSLVKSDSYAEEIVQDVFVKLWLNCEKINPELSIKAYLFTITRNETFNFLKKAARTQGLHEEVFHLSPKEAKSPSDELVNEDYNNLHQQAIELLPPKRRAIYLMSRQEEKSYLDISEELQISVSTVKTQMSLALATIRNYLKINTDLTLSILWFVLLFLR